MTKSIFSKEYETLKTCLVDLRLSKNITQDELANKLGKPQSFVSKYERGERRLDVIEFLEVCNSLEANIVEIISRIVGERKEPENFLSKAGISMREIASAIEKNPSLRGVIIGYIAEDKFEEIWLKDGRITNSFKHDDHDREGKGDRVIAYKGREFIVEVKSLQTNTVRKTDTVFLGKAQVDASDCRNVTLSDGSTVKTTLLKIGEFDILAVCVFAFENKWNYVFAENKDIPRSTFRGYSEFQKSELLASLVKVTWPPEEPFSDNLFVILDRIINRD